MILEVNAESIRDIAAAVHAARKREPESPVIAAIEQKVLSTIQRREEALELTEEQADALRNILLKRAYDQRRTSEGADYADLAERIERDLASEAPPLETTEDAPRPE